MGDQFIRAVDSAGTNIAEGFGRFHTSSQDVICDATQRHRKTLCFLNLSQKCSRLLHIFSVKVKNGSRLELQFKRAPEADHKVEILKRYAPKVYKKYHKPNI